MLREYRLTNFKAFGETVTIPIRPLTLIFGANSSGKSSIFQSLLLLKQTLEEAKNPDTALLPKGGLVDLGTYRDFVHRHETERDFEFGVSLDLESRSNTGAVDTSSKSEKGLPSHREQAIAILNDAGVMNAGLTFRFSYDEKEHAAVSLPCVDLTIGAEPQPLISAIGRQVAINFESEFWRQWWNNIKKRFNDLLDLAYDAELGGEECEVGELSEILQNSPWEDILNDLEEMKGTRILKAREEVEDALNALKEKKDSPLEDIFNAFKERKNEYYSLGGFIQLLEGIIDAEGKVKITDPQVVELLVAAFEETKHHFSHFEYKNFIPDCVDLFEDSPKRKQSIFNAQLCIMTNYPTEDGNTAAYGEVDFLNFQEEVNRSMREVVACLFSPLPQFLESLVYLGPLRSQPERHYEFSGDTTDYVGQSGEYLPSLLCKRPKLVRQINKDLERLEMKYQLKVSKLQYEDRSPSDVFSLRLVHTDTGIDASLRDVGFGISQVLPIVVQNRVQNRLSEKKTLLIEQPEIHLHPAHQAELGDLFIRSAKEQGNTLLLETHSENLILRILRRIRETNDKELPEDLPPIRPEDVAVLYVQPGENGAQVIEIPVTEDGDFACPWPQGFFEEREQDLF